MKRLIIFVCFICFYNIGTAKDVPIVEIYSVGGGIGTSNFGYYNINSMGTYNAVMKFQASINTFDGVYKTVRTMLSIHGKAIANEALAQIVVIDELANQLRIAKFIQERNRDLDKNMALDVKVYLGHCNQTHDALQDLAHSYLLFNPPLHTINHQPIIYQDIYELGYVKRATDTVISNKKIIGLEQATLQYGYSISVLPNIMENNSSIIYLAISISNLGKMNEIKIGDAKIELPVISIISQPLKVIAVNNQTSCHVLGSLQTKDEIKQLVVLVTPNIYTVINRL